MLGFTLRTAANVDVMVTVAVVDDRDVDED